MTSPLDDEEDTFRVRDRGAYPSLTGLALFVVPLVAALAIEYPRLIAAQHECAADYALYREFASESICTTNERRDAYENADLLRCTVAERYVASALPLFCTVTTWAAHSSAADAVAYVRSRAQELTEGVTTGPMLLLGAGVFLTMFYIIWAQRGETDREAIRVGAQQQTTDTLSSVLRTALRARSPALPPATAHSPTVEDVTDYRSALARKATPWDDADDNASDEETVYDE